MTMVDGGDLELTSSRASTLCPEVVGEGLHTDNFVNIGESGMGRKNFQRVRDQVYQVFGFFSSSVFFARPGFTPDVVYGGERVGMRRLRHPSVIRVLEDLTSEPLVWTSFPASVGLISEAQRLFLDPLLLGARVAAACSNTTCSFKEAYAW